MAAEPELEVQIRRPCDVCGGKGKYPTGEGWRSSSGGEEMRCGTCQGTGHAEIGWIPLSKLRDLMAQ